MPLESKKNEYLTVLDIETTGLNFKSDRIIQLSALKIKKSDIIYFKINSSGEHELGKTFNEYILPSGTDWKMNPDAEKIHGITLDFLKKHGREFSIVAREFLEFLGPDTDLAGYNSNKFDLRFLAIEYERAGLKFELGNRKCYDMLAMEYIIHPTNLGAVFTRYTGFTMDELGLIPHNSSMDVLATTEILTRMLGSYKFEEFDNWTCNNIASPDGSIAWTPEKKLIFMNGKYRNQEVFSVWRRDPGYLNFWGSNIGNAESKKVITEYIRTYIESNNSK